MPDKGTSKKVTRVTGGGSSSEDGGRGTKSFVASDESKSAAKKFRIFAILSWVAAIGFEIGAIILLQKAQFGDTWSAGNTWLIVLIVADLIFAVIGSLLWKKANRFDPASEKEKIKFFIQNQLGVIIAVIAFLPLVILIFTNKNMNGKQKGIIGAVAIVALLVAGITGIDFNPPSQEQYAEQTSEVETLSGKNSVYWTKAGTRYHLYSDCYRINTDRTDEIFNGSVAQARELKNITQLCSTCRDRIKKEKGLDLKQTGNIEETTEAKDTSEDEEE